MSTLSPSANPHSPLPKYTAAEQSTRLRRQRGLFLGGAVFVLFSALITRRSLRHRTRLSTPPSPPLSKGIPTSAQAPGYRPAAQTRLQTSSTGTAGVAAEADPAAELNNSGPLVAVEALTVASMNVFSWTIMATGGLLWYFDVGNMADMRALIRGSVGMDNKEAEEEMEEWIAGVLARKEEKEKTTGEGG